MKVNRALNEAVSLFTKNVFGSSSVPGTLRGPEEAGAKRRCFEAVVLSLGEKRVLRPVVVAVW